MSLASHPGEEGDPFFLKVPCSHILFQIDLDAIMALFPDSIVEEDGPCGMEPDGICTVEADFVCACGSGLF